MPPFDPNPLKELLLDEGASLLPYGLEPPAPGSILRPSDIPDSTPLLAAAFGPIELEYASLRTDCVIIDRPDRAVVEISGFDAREFLGRMLTQDVARLEPGQSCNSFWLNRKGRIDADLRLTHWGPRDHGEVYLIDLEAGSAEHFVRTLSAYVISESVEFTIHTCDTDMPGIPSNRGNPPSVYHRLSIHGPKAADLLFAATAPEFNEAVLSLQPNQAMGIAISNSFVSVDRHDTAGVPGYELLVRHDDAADIYRTLLRAGRPDFMASSTEFDSPEARGAAVAAKHHSPPESRFATPASIRLRPCGWFAYNIARIEAGTPLFKLDFGPENLPAETGVINDRVSFKKGCYLGQEIVARMHARGHPKQRLVALRFDDNLPPGPDGLPPLPIQGERVLDPASPDPKPVGSITSSTFSPMLGRVPIAFAMLSWSHTPPGTRVLVEADGTPIGATVQESLRFIP